MTSPVVFAPEAEEQLNELHQYIANAASQQTADRYLDRLIDYCEGLALFPIRGTARDDIRPGLRTTSYKKRTVIAFAVLDNQVMIIGIYHGGRDFESALTPDT